MGHASNKDLKKNALQNECHFFGKKEKKREKNECLFFYLLPVFEKRWEVLFWGLSPSPPSKPTFCLISRLLLKLAF